MNFYDDRVRLLLIAHAEKRGAYEWNNTDAVSVIETLLEELDSLGAQRLDVKVRNERVREGGR